MSRDMRPKQAKLVVSFLFWGFLVLSNATEDPGVLVQCKNQCKHDQHNMKECEDMCDENMMKMMEQEEPFLEDGEEIYQRSMTTGPRTIQETMAKEHQEVVRGYNGVANGALQTICNKKCTSSYTPHKRCLSQCSSSMDNEEVCESSCSILQEKPLIVRCIKVCHEETPGAVDLVLLKN